MTHLQNIALSKAKTLFTKHRAEGFHPSEVSEDPFCLRKDFLKRNLGSEHALQSYMIFNIGHILHDEYRRLYFEDVVYDAEIPISYNTKDGHLVVGSIDGKVRIHDVEYIFELKTMNPDGFNYLRNAKSNHVNQVHFYMKACGLTDAVICYINKSTGELKEFYIEFDESRMELLEDMLDALNTSRQSNELPSCHSSCTGSSRMRKLCPFSGICFRANNLTELQRLFNETPDLPL